MFRKILVPIRSDGKGETVLAHAAAVARRFAAHVQVAHCRPRSEDLMPYGVPIPRMLRDQIVRGASEVADAEEKKLRDDFERLAGEYGLAIDGAPNGDGPTTSWIEEAGRQIDVIKRHGRLCDMIVVAKPDRDRNLGANTLKSALFNTGRPVLMCPPETSAPKAVGERVAIAWNGSIEATRAVALNLALIEKAEDIVILTAEREEIHGATAQDLVAYLALRGVNARIERFAPGGRVGEALLQQSEAVGADVMLMGAYGDSHERETIFGGNTQVVVDSATMPVILVH